MAIKMNKYRVKLTFTEDVLGSVPKDPDIYETYVLGKVALTDEQVADELDSLGPFQESGWTGFHRLDDGTPFIYDYVIKGFFKDACGMLWKEPGSESKGIKAYKKTIDGRIFVYPRKIPFQVNGEEGVLPRSLRAQTAKGERTALAKSDTVPAGSIIEFEIRAMESVPEELLREWFAYGELRGLGQWRNGSYGRFVYEMEVV